jgi:hypothetical protein
VFPAPKGFRTPTDLRNVLSKQQILDQQSLLLLEDLRRLRNEIIHTDHVRLSASEAHRFAMIATRLAAKIREAQEHM